jgi:hypothetical protein
MTRLRAPCLPFLLALLLALLPLSAGAAPVRIDRDAALDWRVPVRHALAVSPKWQVRALPRVRLLTKEVVILPSGRMVIRAVVAVPALPEALRRPDVDLIVLPLPAAMPLALAALAGLALAGRGRRRVRRIAGASRAL